MAERIEGNVYAIFSARGRYPWDEWLEGSVWRLHGGEDFFIDVRNMQKMAGAAARMRNGRCRTLIEDNKNLLIHFTPNTPIEVSLPKGAGDTDAPKIQVAS